MKLKQKQETLGLTYIKYKDNEELKWAAGLFEGEGCLTFKQNRVWYLSLEMTDEDVIQRFAAIWGLKVNGPYQRSAKRKDGLPTKSTWRIETGSREKVLEIVTDIYPDLAERRREKCNEFIDWYQNKCLS